MCAGRGVMVLSEATRADGTPMPARAAAAQPSRYQAFCAAERANVARDLPGLGPKETLAELGRRWTAQKAAGATPRAAAAAAAEEGLGDLCEALGARLALE
jgi:hypothetical protein